MRLPDVAFAEAVIDGEDDGKADGCADGDRGVAVADDDGGGDCEDGDRDEGDQDAADGVMTTLSIIGGDRTASVPVLRAAPGRLLAVDERRLGPHNLPSAVA
jgi:hypothetical protein